MYEPNSSAVIEPLIKRKNFSFRSRSHPGTSSRLYGAAGCRTPEKTEQFHNKYRTNTEWIFIRSVNICTNGQ